MKSIYEIPLNSAEGQPGFLEQYKGKATLIVNTTVGCGNANQLGPLQRLQELYAGPDFQVVAIPTNDYCGPGITYGDWVDGISCGMDSKNYGLKEYNVTFNYSEMISSIPAPDISFPSGEVKVYGEPHELYKEIQRQVREINEIKRDLEAKGEQFRTYNSPSLNREYSGEWMNGNFEKYLVDKDGFVIKHFHCDVLNSDVEASLKRENPNAVLNVNITPEMIQEEFEVVCEFIEKAIAGQKSLLSLSLINA